MYCLHAKDHFNCSPLLFSLPAPQNRCSKTEGGKSAWAIGGNAQFPIPVLLSINSYGVTLHSFADDTQFREGHKESTKRSTTAASHTCFTLSYIGSMWQIESHTSFGWQCTSAFMARHRITRLRYVHWSLKLLSDSIFISPAALLLFQFLLDIFGRHTAVAGPTPWNLFRDNLCETDMHKLLTVFVGHWRRSSLNIVQYIDRIWDVAP